MLLAEDRTSNRSFFDRSSIHQLPGRFDLPPEERIPYGVLGDQVHATSEKHFHGFREIQKPVRIGTGRRPIRHGHHEIDVAAGPEFPGGSGTEDVQPFDAEAPAEIGKGRPVPLDELGHRDLREDRSRSDLRGGMRAKSTSTSSSRRSRRSEANGRAAFRVPVCPACGSPEIRAVVKDWSGKFEGKPLVVPFIEVQECPACGERVYSPEAVRLIQAAAPGLHRKRLARSA